MRQSCIRNFCIIAHIDHGKSTLADRLLEATGTIEKRKMQEQILDSHPIERERGITIKLAPVRMVYKNIEKLAQVEEQVAKGEQGVALTAMTTAATSSTFILNLIDTPGHVDFNYEVSRSLQACEGAILVVDATQGVQAQTLANLNLARKQNLSIIPVINKIDLPNAQVEKTRMEIWDLGFQDEEIIEISAKYGTHIDQVLKAIIECIPAPQGKVDKPLRALVFSSQYDVHKGVVVFVRIVDGSVIGSYKFPTPNLLFMASGVEFEPLEIGYFTPEMRASGRLLNGEVGYIATGLKDMNLAKVGDTVTLASFIKKVEKVDLPTDKRKVAKIPADQAKLKTAFSTSSSFSTSAKGGLTIKALPGYHEPKPMVFLGLYPINSDEYPQVREAMGKLRLSDSAFTYRPISSQALGHGFHCGFLGLLHAEVVQERLAREFDLNLLATAPTVEYKVMFKTQNSKLKGANRGFTYIQSAAEFPDPSQIEQILEPLMQVTIFAPKVHTGPIMQLCQDKRGEYIELEYIGEQVKLVYLLPLSEMIIDFFDKLKGVTQGFASFDYEFFDYHRVQVVKMDILLNHEKVDAFSQLVVEERVASLGKLMVEKLKDLIPRHQFRIPIQAAVGGKIIARADVKPFRKDVTQKLYGGDRTRKDKLLEAQKKGKKRLKMVGRVEIPQNAFLNIFKAI